jgi:uncharacterized protein YcsI (UPF0317 family)
VDTLSSDRATSYKSGIEARHAARQEILTGPTAGFAAGYVQANLVILPQADAATFLRFCLANPRPCPLLAVSEPGERTLAKLGQDLDLARDASRYRVFRYGDAVEEPLAVDHLWRDDLVTFALGCSFTFEHALLADGIPLRHVASGRNVAMYRSNILLEPAGPFSGEMVVSMRPLRPADAIRAIQICTRYPSVHGAPIHLGHPAAIGIHDLAQPDFGDPVPVEADELPVFWACGVTPQHSLESAGLPFAITHSPGHMLITDLRDTQLALM